jgi:hypothetical protein
MDQQAVTNWRLVGLWILGIVVMIGWVFNIVTYIHFVTKFW